MPTIFAVVAALLLAGCSSIGDAADGPSASTVGTPTATATRHVAAAAHRAKQHRTKQHQKKHRRRRHRAHARPATPTPTPTPTRHHRRHSSAPVAARGCSPLTNGGNCYEPGEFCRNTDHGMTGVAGDGERIRCEDNDGWRWEPI